MSSGKLLEQNEHWKQAAQLFEYALSLVDDFHSEDQHNMEESLRQTSFDLTEDTAMAAGSVDPRDKVHYLGEARRDLFGLKNCLVMAKRAGYLVPDPDMMLLCDALSRGLVASIEQSRDEIKEYLKQFDHSDGAELMNV